MTLLAMTLPLWCPRASRLWHLDRGRRGDNVAGLDRWGLSWRANFEEAFVLQLEISWTDWWILFWTTQGWALKLLDNLRWNKLVRRRVIAIHRKFQHFYLRSYVIVGWNRAGRTALQSQCLLSNMVCRKACDRKALLVWSMVVYDIVPYRYQGREAHLGSSCYFYLGRPTILFK